MNTKPHALLLAVAALALGASGLPAQTAATPPPAAAQARPKAIPSTTLTIVAVGKTTSYTSADFAAMPQKSVTVHNSHRDADETYTGILLTDLLAKAGAGNAGAGKALLHSYLKAEGTDKYWVLYSGIEIEAASHLGDVLVATTLDGKPLGDSGAFMLIGTEDRKPQRWVHNLASITLVEAR